MSCGPDGVLVGTGMAARRSGSLQLRPQGLGCVTAAQSFGVTASQRGALAATVHAQRRYELIVGSCVTT
ncbi:MAG: hypothetical protein MUE50_25165 [Pirellulaceae bacterium]|nr:hypothetical protein [Pirellulaceae bacterium]